MRNQEIAKKAKGLTIWIVVSSIIGLTLISFLPWISVEEKGSVKEDLHFNYEMMKTSSNWQIRDLASDLNLINISFWALIILSLLSFIGATIYAYGKLLPAGQILLITGGATLICSILVIDLQLIILGNIEKMNTISASAIFPSMNYTYILLIPSIIILLCSELYTWSIFSYSIQKFKSSKKAEKDEEEEKKKSKKPSKKKNETVAKKPVKKEKSASDKKPVKPKIDEKRVEMEQWLKGEIKNMEEQAVKEKTPLKQPFPEETSDEKEEIPSQIKDEPVKKKFKVRCPQCKYIFDIEKGEGATKTKCPKCSKEGFVK